MKHLMAVTAACFGVALAILLSWTTYFSQLNSSAYDFTLRLAGAVPPASLEIGRILHLKSEIRNLRLN